MAILGVYLAQGSQADPNRPTIAVPVTSLPDQPTSIVLQRLAIFDTDYIGSELAGFTASNAVFGDEIALKGYQIPDRAAPGERITIGLYLEGAQGNQAGL
jgi:hypothetical protein